MTNETKHTPGPWDTGARITTVQIWHDSWNVPTCIADCDAEHSPESEDEKCANALLIAAAPELLECLKEALETCKFMDHNEGDGEGDPLAKWKAAISKAEGRL